MAALHTLAARLWLMRPGLWVLTTGLLLSGLLAWQAHDANRQRAHDDFVRLSQEMVDQIRSRIRLYEYGLRGARGAVQAAGPEGITNEIFHQYGLSRDVDLEFPGARGFGFIRKVPAGTLPQFVQRAQADRPGFHVRALGQPPQGERYIIQYIEPIARNQPAIGLDISSESYRREAARAAMRSGEATLTGPITLVQMGQSPHKSLLFLMPIYRPGMPTTTPAEREAACYGWSYAPLALQEVTATFDPPDSGLQLTLSDVTDPGTHIRLFSNVSAHIQPVLGQLVRIPLYGRMWSAALVATPAFVAQRQTVAPRTVMLVGALLSVLAAALAQLWSSARRRRLASAELNARLAAIVTHSSDAIISQDLDGRVVHWNQAATRLFGWSEGDMLGRQLARMFLPPERQDEDHQILSRLKRHETIAPFDTTRLDAQGRLIDVSVTACAIRSPDDGELLGVAKLIRDIGARKAAERAMQASHQSLEHEVRQRTGELALARKDLQTILDAMPAMIGYWDREQRNRFANLAYLRWFGKAPSELLGAHIAELLGDELYASNRAHIAGALAGIPQTFERTIPRPDGRGVRSSLTHYLPDVVQGQVMGFYVIVHDVTDLVEGRRALDDERARLRNILEGTYTGTWEWDIHSDEVAVNDRWLAIRGRGAQDLQPRLARDWLASLHPDDRSGFETRMRAHLRGETPMFECESRQKHAHGHWVWMRDCGRVMVRSEGGAPLRLFGTTQDIHASRQAQQQREELAQTLGNVLASATEQSIIATNASGLITVFNPGAERMLGYAAAEMVGRRSLLQIHDVDEVRQRAAVTQTSEVDDILLLQAAVAHDERREWTYIRRDGSRLRVHLTVTRQLAQDGTVLGYLGIAHDITRQLAQEQALMDAKRLAEDANRAKSMFLANMSHEIRTPLHAAMGAIHLLSQTTLDSNQHHLLAQALTASRSLLGIVNDVLDLAKIEAGELDVNLEAFDLAELLHDIDELFSVTAQQKGLSLRIEPVPDHHTRLIGDAQRLRQVLSNLLSNALKFTHEGGVELRVASTTSVSSGSCMLKFEVSDTGIGIPESQLERIFTPFTQSDGSDTRRFGGTGLGLSIVRELVHLMGGEVGVHSQEGAGSTFWFNLHLDLAAMVPQTEPQRQWHVVTLHDHADQLWPLGQLCRALGWHATPCTDHMQVITHCANLLACGQPLPEAVLGPEHTDLPALQQALGQLCAEVPEPDRPAIVPLPAVALSSPPSELFDRVNAAVVRHSGRLPRMPRLSRHAGLRGQWLQGVHVLLVDDSEINLDIGKRMLEQEGARVTAARHGIDALDVLAHDDHGIDVVLMDLQMPFMDGFTATRRIRDNARLRHLPVLALTAGALPSEQTKAIAAGVEACLSKPLHPELLVRQIRNVLAERQRVAPPSVQPSSAGGTPTLLPTGLPARGPANRADAPAGTGNAHQAE